MESLFAVTVLAGTAQWVSTPPILLLVLIFEISQDVGHLFICAKAATPCSIPWRLTAWITARTVSLVFPSLKKSEFFPPLLVSLNSVHATHRFERVLYSWCTLKSSVAQNPQPPRRDFFWVRLFQWLHLHSRGLSHCLFQCFLVAYYDRNAFQILSGVHVGLGFFF